jgi:hypothetical protein
MSFTDRVKVREDERQTILHGNMEPKNVITFVGFQKWTKNYCLLVNNLGHGECLKYHKKASVGIRDEHDYNPGTSSINVTGSCHHLIL